jgi:hypothetical protein
LAGALLFGAKKSAKVSHIRNLNPYGRPNPEIQIVEFRMFLSRFEHIQAVFAKNWEFKRFFFLKTPNSLLKLGVMPSFENRLCFGY